MPHRNCSSKSVSKDAPCDYLALFFLFVCFFLFFHAPFGVCVISDGRDCCSLGPACSAGPQPACINGELPAHVSGDFVQLGRFPSDVALPGERELQE